jgi:nitrogen fixation/metabolism regulation signal transduction histidine kinase
MTRSARWGWVVALIALTGLGLVLAFVLSISTRNPGLYERHFVWLYWVNAAVAGLLLLVIAGAGLRLGVRLRAGKFGSRLLVKLAAIFALVGVLPGALIYTVSYQFVTRSIQAWFDVQVEGALKAGLTLGRGTLDALVADVAAKARDAADNVGDLPSRPSALTLERLRSRLGVREVALVNAAGQVLSSAGGGAGVFASERPAALLLRQARSAGSTSQLEGLDDEPGAPPADVRVRAMARVPSTDFQLGSEELFVMVVQPVPSLLAANALAVQAAYREYQQRALARDGLRKMYVGTLTLVLILAVFGAVLLAATLGHQLARPLLLLAQGMRQVAGGDLTAKPVYASRDELGGLTRSFADMTEQLSEAREQVQRGVAQLEGARTNLQTILDNLTAGVIVFDRERRIETVNPGATRILKQPLSAYRGRRLEEVPGLAEFAQGVWQRYEMHGSAPEAGERDHWQEAFELQAGIGPAVGAGREAAPLTLLVRGANLPHEAKLMVFDDITEVVSAQRSAAWAEVARRLAHEIKNPLTPIQLSAERLQHKLEDKLAGSDQAMLQRAVATIVTQVQAMKQLVNEFRDYARLPAAKLQPLDLNTLVGEVLVLYGTLQEQGRLKAELLQPLPAIVGDPTQLRQVVHNLVQNGLDAVADRADGMVRIVTECTRNEVGAPLLVRLKVSDNGPGFADKVLQRAFEPYVTTKAKGTGLGLAVVKKIADEHAARVRVSNLQRRSPLGEDHAAEVIGAQVSLSFSNLAPAQPAPPPAASISSQAH